MENWKGKVAFVTGTSAGIGAAIVTELVKHGMKVVGVARRVEKLQELKNKLKSGPGQFYPIKCDVTDESEILAAFEWTKNNLGGVDVLVNNAGLARKGPLTSGSTETWKTVFDTNVMAVCICTREAIKSMKARGVNGHIIHINSVAGHVIPPGTGDLIGVYSGSKFAVRALADTLRVELMSAGSKIKVTNLSPGYVKTEFIDQTGSKDEFDEVLKNYPPLVAKDIADSVVAVLGTPPHVNITELTVIGI